ncbi:MAG: hypothetical protein M3151_04475, partial [Actinomycetota bacterium]|nr:hypothetical protein [Actinomycetota bacterium]
RRSGGAGVDVGGHQVEPPLSYEPPELTGLGHADVPLDPFSEQRPHGRSLLLERAGEPSPRRAGDLGIVPDSSQRQGEVHHVAPRAADVEDRRAGVLTPQRPSDSLPRYS